MRSDEARGSAGHALVTGASGYVGVNLVRRLLDLGWRVTTFDRQPFEAPGTTDVRHTYGDVRAREHLDPALEGVDVVFHLAAIITLATRDPDAFDVNTRGPAIVARAALDHGVTRLVHCSSVHAFDVPQPGMRVHEGSRRSGPDRPVYDHSKAVGEAAVRDVVDDGLDAVVVNPTGIIGPVDLGPSRANAILRRAARGQLPVAVAGGYDWVDVRDVVDGMVAALEHGRTGESYLLSGHQATAVQIGRLAAGLNGRIGPLVGLPARLARSVAPIGERVGLLWHSDSFTPASIGTLLDDPVVDRTKAVTELGYRARPLEDTVRDLVHWFRDRHELGARDRGFGAWSSGRRGRQRASTRDGQRAR